MLADELSEIVAKVAVLRAQLDIISTRLINHVGDERELRREQGRLSGVCLSLRLAFLYKVEDNWPAVLAALSNAGFHPGS
jgi:hypothetical protein